LAYVYIIDNFVVLIQVYKSVGSKCSQQILEVKTEYFFCWFCIYAYHYLVRGVILHYGDKGFGLIAFHCTIPDVNNNIYGHDKSIILIVEV